MMQLLCNGYRLDLYDSAEVQFTHDNPLFAFDDLKCERTTQFKLPCTPTNDAAFSLARIPAYDGTGMRRKFSAQMQIGTIVKSGYLYVASFDGKDYNAVFVCGELVGLQNIKNAGSIRDIMSSVLGITYGRYELQSILQPVNSTSIEQNFAQINYRRDAAFAHPSADLYWLISSALTHLGQTWDMPRKHYRVIAKDLVHFLQKPLEVIVNNGVTMQIPSGVIGAYFIQEGRTFLRRAWTYQIDPHTQDPVTIDTEDTTTNVSCLVCDVDIELSFPSDFPDYMVVTPNGTMSADFLSDRRVDVDLQSGHAVVSGDKLAGGSVAIPAFTPFFLVRTDEFDYHEEQPQPYPDTWQRVWGWRINTNTRDLNIYAQSSATPQVGDYIVIADNLPDVSVVELCKTYAALTGTILNYSDADGLTFDELNVENWARLHVSRVMKRGEVKRTFSNYAQRNTMQFDSGDGVYPYERVSNAYTIDNANIEEEKELVTIPFSEGGGVGNEVYVRDTNSEDVVASAEIPEGVVWQYLHKCELPLNENMQALCDASTQVQIESRMTAEEYNVIQPNSKLVVEGSEYLWTNRQWQKNISKMTLAMIIKKDTWKPFDPLPADYIELAGIRKTSNNGYLTIGLFGNSEAGYSFVGNVSCTSGAFFWNVFMFNDTQGHSFIFQRGLLTHELNGSATTYARVDLGTSLPKNNLSVQVILLKESMEIWLGESYSSGSLPLANVGDAATKIILQNMQGSINGHLLVYDTNQVSERHLLRDYVPCKRIADNQVGLFDLATREFFYDTNYPNVWQAITRGGFTEENER